MTGDAATQDIYRIEADINFNNYPFLQYNLINQDSPDLSVYGWTISPDGNLKDCHFGILDADEMAGESTGEEPQPDGEQPHDWARSLKPV